MDVAGLPCKTAIRLAVRAATSRQDEARCRAALATLRATRPGMNADGIRAVADDLADRRLRRVARPAAAAGVLSLIVLWVRRRGWTKLRALRWRPLALLAYAFGFAAWFGDRWEHGFVSTFVGAGAAAMLAYALATGARVPADASRRTRVATAAVVLAGTLGAVYLVTEALGTQAVLGL